MSAELSILIPTIILASLSPGLCMTLALTLGMQVGYRRTLYMMAGELIGICAVVILALAGVAALMVETPRLFSVFKFVGGLYLLYVAWQMWHSEGKLSQLSHSDTPVSFTPKQLAIQGFVTAVANPKSWAFMVAILPKFINQSDPLLPQILIITVLIIIIEFCSLSLYASGGKALKIWIQNHNTSIIWVNRCTALLMCSIALWLMAS